MPPEAQETPNATDVPRAGEPPDATDVLEVQETPHATDVPQAQDPPHATEIPEAQETPHAADHAGPEPAATAGAVAGGRRSMRLVVVLGVATIVLGGFGVWATLAAHSLRSTAAGQNVALTDRAATSAVNRQIDSAVNTIFSYNYTDTAKTRRAAQRLLTGPAISEYDKLFALVEQDAPKEKLVVTTTVTSSGVEFLAGGTARVLIFANQQDTLTGTQQKTYAGAMFAVTAIREDGRWKIESIDTFTG